ncbi:MAG: beta-ketoacyl synthase N-terminal-like domain-containing protein, partial [Fimbriiglobus sp.]
GIAPARAACLDPQQRILLEVAWHAVEHAGYDPKRFPGDVGAYLSVGPPPIRRADDDAPEDSIFGLTAGEKDYAASRVAYHLNLTGPCVLVQSASSSSLVAVHSAVESLVGGQCDAAIAGGACVGFPQGGYRFFAEGLWSPDGHCRPYDTRAAGTVPGFGAAVVVLKLLSAALADGDTVHAVIKGSAVNNDGSVKADYLAPSVAGQARVIGQALAAAGVSADTIGYVEGHGTGTPLGDPIEARALTEAFRRDTARTGFCALGSVKANVGHLHTAGGIAGFLKAVLAVKHGVIPPTPHFTAPPADAGFDRTPFFVPTAAMAWPAGVVRRAGVSAFGFGGTNAHVILEEPPALAVGRREPRPPTPFRRHRFPRSGDIPLSSPVPPSPADLLEYLRGLFGAALSKPPAALPADAPFDVLGVDSLLVLSLTRRLEADFGELSKALFFQHSTLRKLADHLAAARPDAARKLTDTPVSQPAEPPRLAAPIAVVGLAGRYPGAADVREFWANLRAGKDAITELPADRWDWRPFAADGTITTRWGGFLDGVDRFDPLFFGITPREGKWLDPQQRLFLETVHSAVEDAGYTRAGFSAAARRAGGEVGVFVGVMNQPFLFIGADADGATETQANHWSVANRVSFCLDFRGPSVAIDTACSSSLTAVHLACEAIRRGECGAAIAGGVNLILHPRQQAELCRVGMLSRGPATRAFGAGGDGFVHGEGVGAVVLKPLAAAVADGDTIYGVILGSAVNSGGRTAGYTVPDPAAQAAVVRRAMANAGVRPADIGYVEAHGTGTELGDPVEIAGLSEAFGPIGLGRVRIGSVKSNVGHLESAAGIVGLTKVLLQLRHREFAPTLHAEPPNPHLNLPATPFRLVTSAEPWTDLRQAGVSSFGAGGTNAHVVVGEAPVVAARTVAGGPWPVVLSARTPEQLRE